MSNLGEDIYEVDEYFPDPHPLEPLHNEDKVKLTPCQQWWARAMTKIRIRHNKKVGAKATLYADDEDDDGNGDDEKKLYINSLNAQGGESGFSILHNVFLSQEFDHYDRYDVFYPHKPTKTEIKTGDKRGSWLGVKDLSYVYTDPPMYYALMEGKFPIYWFIGFIRSTDLITKAHWRDAGPSGKPLKHPMFTAWQWELSKTIY